MKSDVLRPDLLRDGAIGRALKGWTNAWLFLNPVDGGDRANLPLPALCLIHIRCIPTYMYGGKQQSPAPGGIDGPTMGLPGIVRRR